MYQHYINCFHKQTITIFILGRPNVVMKGTFHLFILFIRKVRDFFVWFWF